MLRTRTPTAPARRRGVILLVVIALLTLFAVVGISFVMYAQQRSDAARVVRESQQQSQGQAPNDSPQTLLQQFVTSFIFGQPEIGQGLTSAMRGHELSRGIYGYNPNDPNLNTIPYNGIGRLRGNPVQVPQMQPLPGFPDEYNLVNYTYFGGDGILHDPERFGWRQAPQQGPPGLPSGSYVGGFNAPYTYPDLNTMCLAVIGTDAQGNTVVLQPSFHRDWTTFNVAGGTTYKGFDPNNPNWYNTTNPALKYTVLRPRPADHLLPGESWQLVNGAWRFVSPTGRSPFPPPVDFGGDVRNLPGTGPNDSPWLDLGAKVQQLPDGRKYKAMFAPLIVDLDGRINLNVAGNVRGTYVNPATNPPTVIQSHMSNQGLGPWEMDLSQVLPAVQSNGAGEWTNLFRGNGSLAGRYGVRTPAPAPYSTQFLFYPTRNPYGSPMTPDQFGAPPLFSLPRYYAQLDYDASNEAAPIAPTPNYSAAITLPQFGQTPPTLFPTFGAGYGNISSELPNHPALFNFFQPGYDPNTTYGDRTFDVASNLAPLMLLADNAQGIDVTNSSDLGKLCPTNFSDPTKGSYFRRLVTTVSNDVDRPGLSPWFWLRDPQSPLALTYNAADPTTWTPNGPALPFPVPQGNAPGGEFVPNDWRAKEGILGLGRIDLNQQLPAYPAGFVNDPNAGTPSFNQAQQARMDLATAIFKRIVAVTGAFDLYDPAVTTNPTQQQVDALRWLAQLSANIVDYIDEDDYMTPFHWADDPANNSPTSVSPTFWTAFKASSFGMDPKGKGWVVGTELPRVVLHEVYAEIDNDPVGVAGTTADLPGNNHFIMNFWIELLNTFTVNNPAVNNTNPDDGTATFVPPGATDPAYQVVIAQWKQNATDVDLRDPSNVRGAPDLTNSDIKLVLNHYIAGAGFTSRAPEPNKVLALPATPLPTQTWPNNNGQNVGYYLLGPNVKLDGVTYFPNKNNPVDPPIATSTPFPTLCVDTAATSTYTDLDLNGATYPDGLSYTVPKGGAIDPTNSATIPFHSVFLRRLACPNRPAQPDPTLLNYNPYVTVDCIDRIPRAASGVTKVGGVDVSPSSTAWNSRVSSGRMQPFAAHRKELKPQVNAGVTALNTPGIQALAVQTFFQQNNPAQNWLGQPNTFDWLVHLDRQLISPMELLHVSGYKPHELTQQFMPGAGDGTGKWLSGPTDQLQYYWDTTTSKWVTTSTGPGGQLPFGHRAPWFDQDLVAAGQPASHRLYRLFELVETKNRMAGLSVGGRVPGKVNINTVWDLATFQAICSALPQGVAGPNNFDQQLVAQAFAQLLAQRSPTIATDGLAQPIMSIEGMGITLRKPGPTDRPFRSLTTGLAPQSDPQTNGLGLGLENTLLRSFTNTTPAATDPGGRRLLELPDVPPPNPLTLPADPLSHPYIKDQLLSKIYNNLSTRSNVFAVWLTVGFFTVTDDPTQPGKLGAELGLDQGQNVRHHLFAVIDRSALTMPVVGLAGLPSGYQVFQSGAPNPNAYPPASADTIAAGSNRMFRIPSVVIGVNPSDPNAALMGITIPSGSSATVGVQCNGPTGDPISPAPPLTVRNSILPLQAGSIITVDDGANRETVIVKGVASQGGVTTILADFKKSHTPGQQGLRVYMTLPGNPGPLTTFDPDSNSALVPFYTILD